MRVPSRADGRDLLLFVAVLTIMLGLGLAGSGPVSLEPLPREAAEGSSPPARTVLPGTAASSLMIKDHVSNAPSCRPAHLLASPPGTVVFASIDEDPREYLSKMATLRYRRRVSAATTLDPYQASLNSAVYVAGDTTPIAHDGSATDLHVKDVGPCAIKEARTEQPHVQEDDRQNNNPEP